MPVLPFISDSKDEIEKMVKAANNYGGDYVLYSGLTLYGDALAIVRHFISIF